MLRKVFALHTVLFLICRLGQGAESDSEDSDQAPASGFPPSASGDTDSEDMGSARPSGKLRFLVKALAPHHQTSDEIHRHASLCY